MPKGDKTLTARKYREIHGWDMPTLKLARIMYKENNGVYDEWEKQKRKLYYDFGLKHWTGEW